jgi:vitamin B12 transporter
MPGYALVNLTVARRLTPEWSVELRWNNAGDTRYELVQGYNTPGSNALLSVKWTPS